MCSAASEPSLPPTSVRVGVLGGGQLGQMMALAAHRLGVKLTCLDPGGLASPTGARRPPSPTVARRACTARGSPPRLPRRRGDGVSSSKPLPRPASDACACLPPAGKVCGAAVTGGLADGAAIRKLAAEVDVLTVEIEHIDTASLAAIEAEGKVAVHPSPRTLATIQAKDKRLQEGDQSLLDPGADPPLPPRPRTSCFRSGTSPPSTASAWATPGTSRPTAPSFLSRLAW